MIFLEKNLRYVVLGGIVLVGILLLVVFGPGACKSRQAVEQAKQTTRSGEALGNAAASAVGTLENRVVTDKEIDAAVANVQKEIGSAQDLDAVRNAVLSGVCQKPSHRNDPACAVQ